MASREGPRETTLETSFLVGPVGIRVRSETIPTIVADTTLDALVSSDDSQLSMQGGVSAAIRELAGPVRDEVAADLPLPVGAIAVTSGGRLPLKYVIHAITVDAQERVVPNVRTIRQLFREILSRCEALHITAYAVRTFFDAHLKGATGTVSAAAFPEIMILGWACARHNSGREEITNTRLAHYKKLLEGSPRYEIAQLGPGDEVIIK